MDGLTPVSADPSNIRVKRLAREQSASSTMEELSFVGDSGQRGWYFDERENKICLSQIERRIGDEYSIFVVHAQNVDYSR